ncbi:DNA photolyase phr1 [Rhodosporidiobolus nylandii]
MPARQSDLSAFKGAAASTTTSASAGGPSRRRATRSTSAASPEPAKKRVKREPESPEVEHGAELQAHADEGEDVKPKIEDKDDDGADRARRDRRLRTEERGTVPPETGSVPLAKLYDALQALAGTAGAEEKAKKDGVVVYWMRNKDLRLTDNTALSYASDLAQSLSLPLMVLHVFSPSDYKSHDRSPRRIDFQLRQLAYLQQKLGEMDIPLFTFSHPHRKEIPRVVCEKLEEWGAVSVFGNLEYEVDELRRDTEILTRTKEARESGSGWKGKIEFLHDFCLVRPGDLLTKQGKPYSVYSPFQRSWAALVDKNHLMEQQNPPPKPNDASARSHPTLSPFFDHSIPREIDGFELADDEERERMKHLWPVGEGVPEEVMRRFLKFKVREGKFDEAPLPDEGEEEVSEPEKESRVGVYTEGRNRVDWDGTSHISDFYQHILCFFPRVSMALPYNLKYRDTIEWATDDADAKFEAWKEGKTGVPIVDAAMRALKNQGYMHNRCRMITASYLTKDLLIDWQRGEQYFMQQLLDGDLGANNGGWQWAASTGCDPQPFFRIFNPYTQSAKVDPDGLYIKHWVPELAKLKGKAIHEPASALSPGELKKIGYRSPIVDHAKARTKAIEVYKAAAQKGA